MQAIKFLVFAVVIFSQSVLGDSRRGATMEVMAVFKIQGVVEKFWHNLSNIDQLNIPDIVEAKVFINNADIIFPLSLMTSRVYVVTKKCDTCLVNKRAYDLAHQEIVSRVTRDCLSE